MFKKSHNSTTVSFKLWLIAAILGGGFYCLLPHTQQAHGKTQLTQQNSHGDLQVQKMLADRPQMASYRTNQGQEKSLTFRDSIWQWTARSYNSVINGARIYWDNSDISDKPLSYIADHDIPYPGQKGAIRLRSKSVDQKGNMKTLGFEEMWNACIFELLNIQNATDFLNYYTQALNGEIDRRQFIRQNQIAEYNSLVKLKQFYQKTWIPWAQKHNFQSDEALWEQNLPETYEDWIALYKDTNAYKYWEEYYDDVIVPFRKKAKNETIKK